MTELNTPLETNQTTPSSETPGPGTEEAAALEDGTLKSAADASPSASAAASLPEDDPPVAFDSLELDPDPEDDVRRAAQAEAQADAPRAEAPQVDAAQLDALRGEIQNLKTQVEERSNQYLRITADFENFRKRTSKEQAEQEERIKCSTLLELLPVIDNFERARTQLIPEGEEAVNIHKSYQGIYKQLVEGLKRVGVVPMQAKGQEFDPMLHEAVMREPSRDHEDGIVMEELQRGYLIGDRVLRHAMVKVAVALEPGDAPEDTPQ